MGFCREAIGLISIESRRESFYIHDHAQKVDELGHIDNYGPQIFPVHEDPEVAYEVLDDLIAALEDLRDNDESYLKWSRERPRPA